MSENNGVPADVEMHPDMMTLDQMEKIRNEIASTQPLLGPVVPIQDLLPTYKDSTSPGFIPGIEFLAQKFRGMRQVRGDGNCFYRSLLFSYLETIVVGFSSPNEAIRAYAGFEHNRITEKVKQSMVDLVALGYPEFTLEIFYDVSFDLC